jgi:isoleucyl-tRNA synthetase
VRRTRRRFWNPSGEAGTDTAAAFHTLHGCLVTLATLLAPFTPFVAEELWRNLAAGREGRPESVHLADYPLPDDPSSDPQLDQAMVGARAIVALGRTVRVETKTKVRQPLAEAVVHYPGDHRAIRPLLDLVAEELNVKAVTFAESADRFGRWQAKPNFKTLGPRLGQGVKEVAAALAADDGALAGALAAGTSVTVAGPSAQVELSPDDVELTQEVLEGWGVASDEGITVALDLELTPELRQEGAARDIVRAVQEARKAARLDVSDRIVLSVETSGELAEALRAHAATITGETLAVELRDEVVRDPVHTVEIDGTPVRVGVRRT